MPILKNTPIFSLPIGSVKIVKRNFAVTRSDTKSGKTKKSNT
jgi:hypothetical protein